MLSGLPATTPCSSASSTSRSRPSDIGFDLLRTVDTLHHADDVAPAVAELLRDGLPQPFFLSVGFFETHRGFYDPASAPGRKLVRAAAAHPRHAGDPRRHGGVRGQRGGARPRRRHHPRRASHAPGSTATPSSSAPPTTACRSPDAKGTLTDRGTGVMLILRGPGGFRGGKAVDAMVQHLDVFPTVCELAGVETPAHVQGHSLLPLVRGETRQRARRALHRDDLPRRLRPAAGGAHAALEVHPPLRRPPCIRCSRTSTTARPRTCCSRPAGPTPSCPREALHDLLLDPERGRQPGRRRLPTRTCWRTCAAGSTAGWRRRTTRCATATCPAPPGAEFNTADQRSAGETPVRV